MLLEWYASRVLQVVDELEISEREAKTELVGSTVVDAGRDAPELVAKDCEESEVERSVEDAAEATDEVRGPAAVVDDAAPAVSVRASVEAVEVSTGTVSTANVLPLESTSTC